MQKSTYSPLFIVGVSILIVVGAVATSWIFRSDHQYDVLDQKNATQIASSIVSNTPVSQPKIDPSQNNNNDEPLDISSSTSSVTDNDCSQHCRTSLETLKLPAGLSDEQFEKILGRADELAAYVRQNPAAIIEFLELAKTNDGDKRSIIIEVFNQLDISARRSLSEVLIGSEDWRSRFDGINFVAAQSDIIDKQRVAQLSDMLAVEPNYYVRSSIVKAFNQPDKFHANPAIISLLEQVEYSDVDNTVRGEALLVRVKLEPEPENVIYDALSAIRSKEADYQGYGLRALEQIVAVKMQNEQALSWYSDYDARAMFAELMNPEYHDMPAEIRKIADDLQERFF